MIWWKGGAGLMMLLIVTVLAGCVHVSEQPQAEGESETEPTITDAKLVQTDEIERSLEHAPFYSSVQEVHAWEIDRGSSFVDVNMDDTYSMYVYARPPSEDLSDSKTAVMYAFFDIEIFDIGAMFVVFMAEGSTAYSRVTSYYLSTIGPPEKATDRSLTWPLPSGTTVSVAEQRVNGLFGSNVTFVAFGVLPIPILDFIFEPNYCICC